MVAFKFNLKQDQRQNKTKSNHKRQNTNYKYNKGFKIIKKYEGINVSSNYLLYGKQ